MKIISWKSLPLKQQFTVVVAFKSKQYTFYFSIDQIDFFDKNVRKHISKTVSAKPHKTILKWLQNKSLFYKDDQDKIHLTKEQFKII